MWLDLYTLLELYICLKAMLYMRPSVIITENTLSQNHMMLGIGRHLERSSSPIKYKLFSTEVSSVVQSFLMQNFQTFSHNVYLSWYELIRTARSGQYIPTHYILQHTCSGVSVTSVFSFVSILAVPSLLFALLTSAKYWNDSCFELFKGTLTSFLSVNI